MTDEQYVLVRATWARLAPSAQRLSAKFYERLFELEPAHRHFFRNVSMGVQENKFAMTLAQIAAIDADPRTLVRVVAALGRLHSSFGVTEAAYAHAQVALLWALEHGLGADWTPPVRDAWTEAIAVVSEIMRRATGHEAAVSDPPSHKGHQVPVRDE